MKKINLLLFLLVMFIIPVLQSCDNDDDYSLDNYMVGLATVSKNAEGTIYFVLDNGETLWPAASFVPYQKLENGTRIIGSFTLLSDKQNGYDHFVRLNDYSTVLTKGIINLTEANKDSIGDDPVRITDMWRSGNYINVEFDMNLPLLNKHRVNLVRNTMKNYEDDGYIHLEYRYNDMDDVTSYIGHSIVSFWLGDLRLMDFSPGFKGWKIRINSAINGEKIITIDYPSVQSMNRQMKMESTVGDENIK